jgi:hypothetical protein
VQVEIEIEWSDGEDSLRRTRRESEITSDETRDVEMLHLIRLLDDTWQEVRAAIINSISPRAQSQVTVAALLTPQMAARVQDWKAEQS